MRRYRGEYDEEGQVIIFGFGGSKLTDRGSVWPATCPNCHNQVLLHHATTHASFRLFFVPIVKYNRKHYLMCPTCHKGPRLDAAEVKQVEAAKLLLARVRIGELTETSTATSCVGNESGGGRAPGGRSRRRGCAAKHAHGRSDRLGRLNSRTSPRLALPAAD